MVIQWHYIFDCEGTNWKVNYALTLDTARLAQVLIVWVGSYKLLLANMDIDAIRTSSAGDASPLSLSKVALRMRTNSTEEIR